MKFLRKCVFVVLIMSISAVASDLQLKWRGCLKAQLETSFCIDEGHYWQIWPESILYKDGSSNVDLLYKNYEKDHGIDIATLRGDNFYPREFWTQSSEKIFHIIFPILKKNKVFDIVNCKDDEIDSFSSDNLGYDFKNGLPKEFPEAIEYLLEKDVFEEINEWMKKQGLKPIGWYSYQESLHNHYGAKEPLKVHDPKARRLPLYEYFLPYLNR